MNKKTGYKNMSLRSGEMITCILNEGNLSRDGDRYSVQSELHIDDFVELDIKSRNVYDGYWSPFVSKCKQNENSCVGLVVSQPRWMNLPTTSPQTSWGWDELRESNCYRLAVIYLLKPIAVLGNMYMRSEEYVVP
jgi:hypothetical protein